MDIKKVVENLLKEIKKDGDLKAQFEKNPVKVVEKVVGVDLPDDIINKVIDTVKKNVDKDEDGFDLSDVMDMAKDIDVKDAASMLKKLF